jgi:hypothetical protein
MRTNSLVFVALAMLSGCAARLPLDARAESAGGCLQPGAIDTSLFEGVADTALQRQAVRSPDSGGVRCASTYRLKPGKNVAAYRVYGGNGWRLGRWWAFSRPGADSTAYRSAYEICRRWNSLDSLAVCELKAGTRFAIGPGQSADCGADPRYGTSDSLQVFFANPPQDLDTSRCTFQRKDWKL